jgi:predicted RNase H-like nuclease (RuvC/YqgF family)
MTIERKVSSIESSFSMENLKFDDECRKRVKAVLTGETTVTDAIKELDKKYRVSV